jgi:hypothetical protein
MITSYVNKNLVKTKQTAQDKTTTATYLARRENELKIGRISLILKR